MSKLTYYQQLKHPLWQKKRLEVLELHDFACQECSDSGEELNVHHPFYKHGAMIWEYKKEELKCLCKPCHIKEHELDERIKKATALANTTIKWQTLGFLEAFAAQEKFDSLYDGPHEIREKPYYCKGSVIIEAENFEYGEGIVNLFQHLTIDDLMAINERECHYKIDIRELLDIHYKRRNEIREQQKSKKQ